MPSGQEQSKDRFSEPDQMTLFRVGLSSRLCENKQEILNEFVIRIVADPLNFGGCSAR